MTEVRKTTPAEFVAAMAIAVASISLLVSFACYSELREVRSATLDMNRSWQELRKAVLHEREPGQ